MILYALFLGVAALAVSGLLAVWRLVTGRGVEDGEWALDMIAVNAVVMVVLFGVTTAI